MRNISRRSEVEVNLSLLFAPVEAAGTEEVIGKPSRIDPVTDSTRMVRHLDQQT
jgi:hypothetical protein